MNARKKRNNNTITVYIKKRENNIILTGDPSCLWLKGFGIILETADDIAV
jgi:hypothetical protein